MSSARCITRALLVHSIRLCHTTTSIVQKRTSGVPVGRAFQSASSERGEPRAEPLLRHRAQSRAERSDSRVPPRQFSISALVACCSTRLDSTRRPACFGRSVRAFSSSGPPRPEQSARRAVRWLLLTITPNERSAVSGS